MNTREIRLLIILAVVLVGGGGGFLVWQWFYKPLVEANASIKKLSGEIEVKQAQLDTTLSERKLLERARIMSLSPNPEVAISEYGNFLYPVLDQAKLKIDTFRPAPTVDMGKGGPQSGSTLKPGHQIVSFQVRVKGDLEGLVKALTVMQTTPLVHRIKTLSIDRVDSTAKAKTDELTIGMTVEAMIVSKSAAHVDGPLAPDQRLIAAETLLALRRGPTGIALLPWVVGPTGPFARKQLEMESGYKRHYADVGYKNIFIGLIPPPPFTLEDFVEDETPFDVNDYIRLDTTDPVSKEAWFRNLIFKERPKRVRVMPGYDIFRIDSEFKTKTLLRAKVLRVDQRDVYFQIGVFIYGIHLGQSVGDAIRRTLSDSEIDRLGLTDLYDEDWAAQEGGAKKTTKKKTGR